MRIWEFGYRVVVILVVQRREARRRTATSKVRTSQQCWCTTQIQLCVFQLCHTLSGSSMCALNSSAGAGSCTSTAGRFEARFTAPAKPATKRVYIGNTRVAGGTVTREYTYDL